MAAFYSTISRSLPFSILTDVIHANGLKTGVWREGVFTGVRAAEKAALAFRPLVEGAVLSLTGFISAKSGSLAQPVAALVAINVLFAFLSATPLVGSGIILSPYRTP